MSRRKRWFIVLLIILLFPACRREDESENRSIETGQPIRITALATAVPLPPRTPPPRISTAIALAPTQIAQIWANDGGDKVSQDELRATFEPDAVLNSIWNGGEIHLFAALNEIVSFNLVLEASESGAEGVTVSLGELAGPDGGVIGSRAVGIEGLFDYTGRNIELFYVRYLEIQGISTDLFYHGYNYDERHVPARCRRPHDDEGTPRGGWQDRPCHNKFYPDIAVPLVLETPFAIAPETNQSIWADIYVPKGTPPGEYKGVISVHEEGVLTWEVPIILQVHDFNLPDLPSARTMVFYSLENLGLRYLDESYPETGSSAHSQLLDLADRHFQMAHRHKISLIDDYTPIDLMEDAWLDRLTGDLFTPERGYEGPGVGLGNNVYSIGTYGGWPWEEGSEEDMWANTDAWMTWFDNQSLATSTDTFLYLIDEPGEAEEFRRVRNWLDWMENNPGPGQRLLSLATIDLPTAEAEMPTLDIPASWAQFGSPAMWQNLAEDVRLAPDRRLFLYNGGRPATGSFGLEDEGIALRVVAWSQFKKGIERWFYWESTYYENFQDDMGQTNVFQSAQTFGSFDEVDEEYGRTGNNYLNGDGLLFYPGTDRIFPESSYDVMGPIASLRLKHWRRGIQDVDYLNLARQVDPERTAEIVSAMVPAVLWEVGITDPDDPTYVLSDISWPVDPDVWEAARAELAAIILSANQKDPGTS